MASNVAEFGAGGHHGAMLSLDEPATALGYVGAAAIVLTYFANQAGALRSDDWRSPAVNLLGSGLIALSLLVHMNRPSLLIEAFWSMISVYGLWRCLGRR